MLARKELDDMNYNDKIYEILKGNHGVITFADCHKHRIPSIYLTRMVSNNLLTRLQRGIYVDQSGDYDDYYFFQIRFNKCVFSYQSALFFHGLTDRIPFKKEVTLYKGYNPHTIPSDVITHFVSKDIYEVGIIEMKTQFGNTIKVYDKERSICDLIKNRKNTDVEIFKKAIKGYIDLKNKDVNKLYRYANVLKIEKEVNEIMEVLYE